MRKLSVILSRFFALLIATPAIAANEKTNRIEITATPKNKEVPAEVQVMLNRLEEIKTMDRSNMSRAEKKELRKEVRTIKKTLKASGNGVYLSIGAIVIIILLLILLL
ncbi:MAG: hypothetical protein ACJAQ1_001479 [Flavobacterium sp.]|jgi:hypothetical protein